MRPADTIEYFMLTAPLPDGRVHELARVLRRTGLFPLGKRFEERQVKIEEGLLFLWCVFTNTTAGSMATSLMYTQALESKAGRNFMNDLNMIFKDVQRLRDIDSLELTSNLQSGVFAQINFIDGSSILYGHKGRTQYSTKIQGDYLRDFALHLYSKQFNPFHAEQLQTLEEAFECFNSKEQ